ncbi:Uncharacterised protein [Mycobacterium tuberculosis]|nr:Uncharacterised protein [Mycobacterium tuberculosis]COX06015.1 Uncharacterised protein [Mycobacterium tuberculosis]COZ90741.1 Uncharacterised protein [Mycobacterium tuberculosis]
MPIHRRFTTVDGEEVMGEAVGEVVQIGQIDARKPGGGSHDTKELHPACI